MISALPLPLWQALLLAFVLDMILGDPRWMPHPIRLMGWLIDKLEKPFRTLPVSTVRAGGFFAVFLIIGSGFCTWILLAIGQGIYPWLGSFLEIIILYFCIAPRCLDKAAMAVEISLRQNNTKMARNELSMIVGRETRDLNRTQMCRAAIETVAENFVDGVLSPLFWIALGGAPAAMMFKMVSTLDSMVGYKNEEYHSFGKVSARLDDAANFIPARLSVPLIAVTARMLGLSFKQSFRTGVLEGGNHKSPNSGYPEAAFAGALNVRLNGPAVYHGKLVEKPFIGTRFGDPTVEHIQNARSLMLVSSMLGTAFIILTLLVFSFV